MKPANARQERELAKLSDAIDGETRPSVEARYSDKNRLNHYSLSGNFSLENEKYGLSYRHTDVSHPSR
ncbi:MAG TPA: hypothetical protein VMS25_01805, partial [Candidatus Limnocylindrales bacterium]|nr:hypothetical protein [Candidatus Limnocylindrales bacterium]